MDTPPSPRKRSALQVQRSVVFALYLRELRTRFGSHRLGYLWVALEPLAHVGVLLLVFGLLNTRTMPNISFPVFLATGVLPWMLFSSTVNRCMAGMSSNQGLMGFSPVKPIDTVLTRVIVELLMFIAAALVLCAIAWWLGFPVAVADPLLLIFLTLTLLVFGGSLGLILAVLAHRRSDVGKFVPIVLRPLYFVSGVFFMMAALPTQVRQWAMLNPLAHWLDLMRVAMFDNYPRASGSLLVVSGCTLAALVIALMTYRVRRFDLVAT